jgi:hypothetical protein
MRKRIGALLNRWHRRMPVFRLPLVAPSFDRPIFVDRLCGDALRARTGGRNIVRGLATCFGGRVHDDDPRSDCIQLLVGRLVVGWNCVFVPGPNRTDRHVV